MNTAQTNANALQAQFEAIYRAESRRVFATLVRLLGDFDVAEEALHDAFRAALEQWPNEGVPANPRAWLVSAGRFKAIDAMRRGARFTALDEEAAENIADDGSTYANWWKNRGRWHMKEVTQQEQEELFAIRVSNPSISWWGHRAAFNYQAAVALPKVQQPILILNPEDDDLAPMTPRAKPLLKNPASRIHGLPGWAHGFLDVKTAEAAKIVRDFLDV